MQNEKPKHKGDLRDRIYKWVLELVKFVDSLAKSSSTQIIANQLLRSGTSVGANYVESQAGSSRKDFVNFLNYALKSANESRYWLAILRDTDRGNVDKVRELLSELDEIRKILAASIITTKNNE